MVQSKFQVFRAFANVFNSLLGITFVIVIIIRAVKSHSVLKKGKRIDNGFVVLFRAFDLPDVPHCPGICPTPTSAPSPASTTVFSFNGSRIVSRENLDLEYVFSIGCNGIGFNGELETKNVNVNANVECEYDFGRLLPHAPPLSTQIAAPTASPR